MRVRHRQLIIPAALVIGLWIPAMPAATAARTTTPQRITGTVQTIIVEPPREGVIAGDSDATDTGHADTTGLDPSSSDLNRPGTAHPDGTDTDGVEANDTVKVLRAGNTVVPLAEGSLPTTPDGAKVSVTVVPAADGAKQVVSATTIAAPAATAAPAAHRVYVALAVPSGVTAATPTAAAARTMVARVSRYWSDQTGGQVTFSASQVLAYRSAYTCGDYYGMWAEGLRRMPQASGPGRHLVVVVPSSALAQGCAYGLGTVGAVGADGNLVHVTGLNQSLLAHELGHNLGLYHSNSLRCGGAQDRPMVSRQFPGCQAKGYDDLFDVMGFSGATYGEGNLNAVHLDGMGLLPRAVRKIPAGSGVTTARISPLSTTMGARTLKVTDSSGAHYFVEYRTNSGRDSVGRVNPFQPAWGVRVLREDPAAPASAGSYELDATPTSQGQDYNRSIPVGGVFTAASGKLTLRVKAADSTGATVTIASWTSAVVPSKATLSIPARALVGTAIRAATKVTNAHGLAVTQWPVTLQKRLRGTSTWRSVKTLHTTSTGAASYRFPNGLSGSYRWVTGTGSGGPVRLSRAVAVTATARVVAKAPAPSMAHGGYLSVTGQVSPVPAPVVDIQYRYRGGAWRTGPRASVRGTTVRGRIRLGAGVTAYTRFHVRSAASYAGSISATHATSVR
jgi:hypothetical protein